MDITKRQITKIAREIAKFTARTMKADGIGVAEFDVVHAIRKNPGITPTEICKILSADKGAIAKQLINLENKGYITRTRNPLDGRSQIIFPTEKANSLKNSKAHIESQFYEWLLKELNDEEKEEFAKLLNRIYLKCKNESKANFPNISKIINEEEA